MHDQPRIFIPIAAVCALLGALVTSTTSGADVPSSQHPPTTLVILGASYAKSWGEPTLPGYERIINRGVGGDETSDMLRRFATDVSALKPDTVLIWGLVNNITRSKPAERPAATDRARADHVEMLRLARAAGIQVILATEVPWTESPGILNGIRAWIGWLRGKQSYAAQISAAVREVNDQLRLLAVTEKCRLLDFEMVFANEAGTRKPEYAADDGSHITQAGYDALTAHARAKLQHAK